jgi:hypothetical protein
MAKSKPSAVLGISDHAGFAIVVCMQGKELIDRRRIELVEAGVPCMPYHHDAQGLPMEQAVALVVRVRASAERCVQSAFDQLPARLSAIAIRARPKLPETVEERLTSYWAQNRADWVMYRDVMAETAEARGWAVHEYESKSVFGEAARALGVRDLAPFLQALGQHAGRPWDKDHKLAVAAAIATAKAGG